jgi:hypothetical protein
LIAKQLNYKYECYAECGIGNLKIADLVLSQLAHDTESLYIVQWTGKNRFDIKPDNWHTIVPKSSTDLAVTYYKNYYNDYTSSLTNLIYIKSIIELLNSKNVNYIMTYSYDDVLVPDGPAIELLINSVKPHLISFNGHGMYDWAKINNYPCGARHHPLEEAHQAAADYIKENILL